MITLATSQASTWGYNIVQYTTSRHNINTSTGGATSAFTKLTLAPNGKFYSIFAHVSITINNVVYTNVIAEITPGTTNTRTTNWAPATFNYLTPDPGVLIGPSGFGKPAWTNGFSTNGAASIAFNTGILAPNGLIYFAPLSHRMALPHQWVILNPNSGEWKKLNLYPEFPTATFPDGIPIGTGGTPVTGRPVLTAPTLGPDGKMYVIRPNFTIYRFTPTNNALEDEDSLESIIPSPNPLTATNGVWQDEAGASFTDPGVTTSAYTADVNNVSSSTFNITDAIAHPNGNIYWIPGTSRGRIFYTKPSVFGIRPFVSAPGLLHTKRINGYYAFLEKPRNADHDPTTLKIYIVSRATLTPTTDEIEVLCLNPVTHTLSVINLGMSTGSQGGVTKLGKNITLANGMHISRNFDGTLKQGRTILTGIDVPSTVTNGARTIPLNSNDAFTFQTPATGIIYSDRILGETSPGQSHIGGGANVPYPHHSKFIGNFGSDSPEKLFTEIVSVKQYGPDITNFNFTNRDIPFYSVPSTGLPGSIFNANFNKRR
jgi:hypothetical protein